MKSRGQVPWLKQHRNLSFALSEVITEPVLIDIYCSSINTLFPSKAKP